MTSNGSLIFSTIKSDFAGEGEIGASKMRVEIGLLAKPKKNKEGSDSNYLLQTMTSFYYDNVKYTSLILEDITITGIMKKNGAVPITLRSLNPELFNFMKIRDEKYSELYERALSNPENRDEVMVKNAKYKPNEPNSGVSEYTLKPSLVGKKYAPSYMAVVNDEPIEDPLILFKIRANREPKYIYSCVFDMVSGDGTISCLVPNRKMPINNVDVIKRSLKPQYKIYFGTKDVKEMLDRGEYVHDLPMYEDIIEQVIPFSTIVLARMDLSCKLLVSKTNACINCDILPTYLRIKPNNNKDLEIQLNDMRNFGKAAPPPPANNISFSDAIGDSENNNNL